MKILRLISFVCAGLSLYFAILNNNTSAIIGWACCMILIADLYLTENYK